MKKKTTKPTKPTYQELERENRKWRAAAAWAAKRIGLPVHSKSLSDRELRDYLKTLARDAADDMEFIEHDLRATFFINDDDPYIDPCLLAIKARVVVQSHCTDSDKLRYYATAAPTVINAIKAKQPKANADVN